MTSLTIRLDAEALSALTYIQERTGADKSESTRAALIARSRWLRAQDLRRESATLRDDPADRAEMLRLALDLAEVNAW
ncbi:MAG: hypothetical protein LBK72_06585 [Bifidobacteriaceae bacterium]|jgi:hypothetical protein|nr:hypothetical protein [Bifidobacteriaceae bacterium]